MPDGPGTVFDTAVEPSTATNPRTIPRPGTVSAHWVAIRSCTASTIRIRRIPASRETPFSASPTASRSLTLPSRIQLIRPISSNVKTARTMISGMAACAVRRSS